MTGRQWTLTVPAPTILVPDRKKGQPKPPGGWPKKPAAGWLSMNGSYGHWMAHASLVGKWRRAATEAAMVARLPKGAVTRAHFEVTLRFTRGVRREPTNWHPTGKALVDALTRGTVKHPGWGFLPDDAPKYLHCPECPHIRISPDRLERKPFGPLGEVILTITEMDGGTHA